MRLGAGLILTAAGLAGFALISGGPPTDAGALGVVAAFVSGAAGVCLVTTDILSRRR